MNRVKAGDLVQFYACKRGNKQGLGSLCQGTVLSVDNCTAYVKRNCKKVLIYEVPITDGNIVREA